MLLFQQLLEPDRVYHQKHKHPNLRKFKLIKIIWLVLAISICQPSPIGYYFKTGGTTIKKVKTYKIKKKQ